MILDAKPGVRVADARTGREHGRVKSVLERPVVKPRTEQVKDDTGRVVGVRHVEPREGVFLVELAAGGSVRVSGADLTVRFTSQSKDYGKEF